MEYRLTFLKGCPFMDCGDGLMLIDTGLQRSIADRGIIRYGGETVHVDKTYGPVNTAVLTEWFERPIVGAVGDDLLLRYPIKIDYKGGLLTAGYDGPVGEQAGREMGGLPMVELSIDGRRCRCFIDTGAQYSNIQQRMVAGKAVKERVEDCKWGVPGNRYETDLFPTVFACNGVEYEVACAAIDPFLEVNLERAGVSGVTGKDFFDHHAIVIKNGIVYASNH